MRMEVLSGADVSESNGLSALDGCAVDAGSGVVGFSDLARVSKVMDSISAAK